jgi:hypothetical protein
MRIDLALVLTTALQFAVPTIAQQIEITEPANDIIALEATLRVVGNLSPGAGAGSMVTVKNGSNQMTVPVQNGKWEVSGLGLFPGINHIEAISGSTKVTRVITRGNGLSRCPHQKVRFVWHSGIDAVIEQIAVGTLDATLTPQQLEAFSSAVKSQTVAIFTSNFLGVDVEVVDADGPDVHTIDILTNTGPIFGQSPFDFANKTARQSSEIWIGTFRDTMIGDEFAEWQPMRKDDSLGRRIVDISEAMARTCTHEFGHSLGLVGSGSAAQGGWMMGCEGGHNCAAFDAADGSTTRFDNGFHIMDPGQTTLNNARIAEPTSLQRSATRRRSTFSGFDRSYFSFILPLP